MSGFGKELSEEKNEWSGEKNAKNEKIRQSAELKKTINNRRTLCLLQ